MEKNNENHPEISALALEAVASLQNSNYPNQLGRHSIRIIKYSDNWRIHEKGNFLGKKAHFTVT
jgi:hypothetical protein